MEGTRSLLTSLLGANILKEVSYTGLIVLASSTTLMEWWLLPLPTMTPHIFFFIPTDPGEIIKITNKLKMKSSQGFDNMLTKLLKYTIDELLIPLTHVINLSVQSGTVPETLSLFINLAIIIVPLVCFRLFQKSWKKLFQRDS